MTFCAWVRTSQNQLLIIGSLWAPQPPTPLILPQKLIVMAVDRHGASQNWPAKMPPKLMGDMMPTFFPSRLKL